jgi:GNAT superfamily N-acetyltransferase
VSSTQDGQVPLSLSWLHEVAPTWDADKRHVLGSMPDGALDLSYAPGAPLPGDWWMASTSAGSVLGYGWLDATWGGDAEILLAVRPSAQGQGVGSFILAHLEAEAALRGLNYVYNSVPTSHPRPDRIRAWLEARGYRGSGADPTLRKLVGADRQRRPAPAGPTTAHAAPSRSATGGGLDGAGSDGRHDRGSAVGEPGDRGPGHEESGGYVDVERHQY